MSDSSSATPASKMADIDAEEAEALAALEATFQERRKSLVASFDSRRLSALSTPPSSSLEAPARREADSQPGGAGKQEPLRCDDDDTLEMGNSLKEWEAFRDARVRTGKDNLLKGAVRAASAAALFRATRRDLTQAIGERSRAASSAAASSSTAAVPSPAAAAAAPAAEVTLAASLRELFPSPEEAPTPLNRAADYAACRAHVCANGGCTRLEKELADRGVVRDGQLTTGLKPLNVFARLVSKDCPQMSQPAMDEANARLGAARARYTFACNLEANDEHWSSDEPSWVGRASMSEFHRFMLINDLSWSGFNVLTFGLDGGAPALRAAIARLREMRQLAREFAAAEGRAGPIGLYFHCYPRNTVQALHMHIVDEARVGPTFQALAYKNMPLDAVLSVLEEEEAAAGREVAAAEREAAAVDVS